MSDLNEKDKDVIYPSIWLWIPQLKVVDNTLQRHQRDDDAQNEVEKHTIAKEVPWGYVKVTTLKCAHLAHEGKNINVKILPIEPAP